MRTTNQVYTAVATAAGAPLDSFGYTQTGGSSAPLPELMQDPSFQTSGKFDPAKYERWLASPSGQAAIPYLEDRYRDALLQAKLRIRVTSDVFVSDAALWERYRDEHEKARFGVLIVDPASAIPDNAAPVSEQEAQDYYRAHRNDFKRPHAAFLSYLALPRLPDASDTAAALARARALREEISKGTPFAEVARRESSDTVSGKNGGELGEQNPNAVDSAFARAALALPLNTLSEPVRTGFGFHLIEVESRKAGAGPRTPIPRRSRRSCRTRCASCGCSAGDNGRGPA